MKKLMELMAEELASAFEKAGYNPEYGKVTVSNRPDLCEFQCNGAMAGAKAYKKAPFMIADDVVEHLKDSQIFAMAEVVKPGFINLQVKEEFLADYLKKMAADEKYSVKTEDNHYRLRRTECCKTTSCRSSSFCDHWGEYQTYRTFCRTQSDR